MYKKILPDHMIKFLELLVANLSTRKKKSDTTVKFKSLMMPTLSKHPIK